MGFVYFRHMYGGRHGVANGDGSMFVGEHYQGNKPGKPPVTLNDHWNVI